MEKKLKPAIILGILILIFASQMFFEERGRQNEGNITVLNSMDPQSVISFRIYPKVSRPVGSSVVFKAPDPIIEAFFQSLTDIRAYLPNHDTAWQEQQWFLEVYAKGIGKMIPISFYIPSRQGNIIVADMMGNDGYFQSRKLFQWYQKYSHRWLSPPAAQEEDDEKVRR